MPGRQVPMLEPATSECKEFTKLAYEYRRNLTRL